MCDLVPLLDPAYVAGGLLEPDAMAIDVAALHQGYLRGVRRQGRLVTDAEVTAIARTAEGWRIESTGGAFCAGVLVDAAGAWADELAGMAGVAPIGLVPKRRTAILIEPPDGLDPSAWPMVIDLDERFYIKPEGGMLLVSPADETPVGALRRAAGGDRRRARGGTLRGGHRAARYAASATAGLACAASSPITSRWSAPIRTCPISSGWPARAAPAS